MDQPQPTLHFDGKSLVPEIWRGLVVPGIPHVFNPSIIADENRFIMAYRVVLADGERHIAICRLGADLRPQPGTIVPFTAHLSYAGDETKPVTPRWAADPRLSWLAGGLFLDFNTGCERPNSLYIAEVDPATLLPAGAAREVRRPGRRRMVEKNWIFFGHGDDSYVIYQFAPLEILKVDLSPPDHVLCTPAFRHDWVAWQYEQTYGTIRGSASPVLHAGRLVALTHSNFQGAPRGPADLAPVKHYVAAIMAFEASPPFAPVAASAEPLAMLTALELALGQDAPLIQEAAETLYPSGAVARETDLLISYGINDRYAALRPIGWEEVAGSMVPACAFTAAAARRNAPAGDGERIGALRSWWWESRRAIPFGPADRAEQNARGYFMHGNFGDMSGPFMLQRLTGMELQRCEDGPRLLTVGSVLQCAHDGDVIWGTGLKGASAHMVHKPERLHVIATRGPITLDFLRRHGFDVSRVTMTFDPAVLLPHLFAAEIAALRQQMAGRMQDLLVIPHFRDDTVMRQLYPEHLDRIVAADTPVFRVIARMLAANLVVSSSLHGLILAEALGVPAVWHRPLMGEDEMKFHDYYYGTGRYRVVRAETLREALRVSPMPLPAFDTAAILATFPSAMELVEFGLVKHRERLQPGRQVRFSEKLEGGGIEALSGWSLPEPHGRWNDSELAELAIDVGDAAGEGVFVELRLSGYLPFAGTVQRIAVSDGTGERATWIIDQPNEMLFQFPVRTDAVVDHRIVLTFRFLDASSPLSLGLGLDQRPLAALLISLQLITAMPEAILRRRRRRPG